MNQNSYKSILILFIAIQVNDFAFGKEILCHFQDTSKNSKLIEPVIKIEKIYFHSKKIDTTIFYTKSADTLLVKANGTLLNIKFSYKASYKGKTKKIKYRVKLEGYDQNWLPVSTNKFVIYKAINPGTYFFEIIACNPYGIWTVNPVKVLLIINP